MDFHALNRVTEKDHHPLPLILDLLMSPAPTRIYSKIDLKHAYHLVCIAKGDESKTAFCTWSSSYKWQDRKSTRLNSSHTVISYAVFCLKKKKHKKRES